MALWLSYGLVTQRSRRIRTWVIHWCTFDWTPASCNRFERVDSTPDTLGVETLTPEVGARTLCARPPIKRLVKGISSGPRASMHVSPG